MCCYELLETLPGFITKRLQYLHIHNMYYCLYSLYTPTFSLIIIITCTCTYYHYYLYSRYSMALRLMLATAHGKPSLASCHYR